MKKSQRMKGISYFYRDRSGNVLQPDDIYFTCEDVYQKTKDHSFEKVKDKYYRVGEVEAYKKDMCAVPSIAVSPEGKLLPVKVNPYDNQLLPKNACRLPLLSIDMIGSAGSGKTSAIQTILSPKFHNLISSEITGFYICDGFKEASGKRELYDEKLKNFVVNGIVPDATKAGELKASYCLEVHNGKTAVLLQPEDFPGESYRNVSYDSQRLSAPISVFCISAEELQEAEKGSHQPFQDVIEEVFRKKQLLNLNKGKLLVVITMADKLKSEPLLEGMIEENTVEVVEGEYRYTLKAHKDGFDFAAYKMIDMAVRKYLKAALPCIYNELCSLAESEESISFFLQACLGSDPDCNGKVHEYRPYRPEELWLYILAENGFYPELNAEPLKEEEFDDVFDNELFDEMKNYIGNAIASIKSKIEKFRAN